MESNLQENVQEQQSNNFIFNYIGLLISKFKEINVPMIKSNNIIIARNTDFNKDQIKLSLISNKNSLEREILSTKITQEKVVQAYLITNTNLSEDLEQKDFDLDITPVTLKLLPLNVDLLSTVDEILNEVKLLINSNHSSIPKLYGVLDNKEEFGLILERVEGISLEQIIYPKDLKYINLLTLPFKFKFLEILIEVVSQIHEIGFFHGDLKPSNIIVVKRNSNCEFCKEYDGLEELSIEKLCKCRLKLVSFGESKISSRTLTFTSAQMNGSIYKAPEFFHIHDEDIFEKNNENTLDKNTNSIDYSTKNYVFGRTDLNSPKKIDEFSYQSNSPVKLRAKINPTEEIKDDELIEFKQYSTITNKSSNNNISVLNNKLSSENLNVYLKNTDTIKSSSEGLNYSQVDTISHTKLINKKEIEAYNGESFIVGKHSDIWSLGCIICELMSGLKPWKNKCKDAISLERCLCKKKKFPIPELVLLDNSEIYFSKKSEIKSLIEMCLTINPEKRLTAVELGRLLNKILYSEPKEICFDD